MKSLWECSNCLTK